MGMLIRFKRMNVGRLINKLTTTMVYIIVMLMGILAGYTIMLRSSTAGIQTVFTFFAEVFLLTLMPVVMSFSLSLLIIRIRIGRVR
ncbi:MAG: hypothetical protein N3D82_01620 [Ignisphaera sp.]|nr:hypothetical protein [Ignisphaera sp.]MCX8167717.1 hypothetical protein [Ignisphaera sp.]MDW8085281.1 hypothetical protein [Ignisphaera sp.]